MKKLLLALIPIYGLASAGTISQQPNTVTMNVCNNATYNLDITGTPLDNNNYGVVINGISLLPIGKTTTIATVPATQCMQLIMKSNDSLSYPAQYVLFLKLENQQHQVTLYISDINSKITNNIVINTARFNINAISPYLIFFKYNSGLDTVITTKTVYYGISFNDYTQSEKYANPNSQYDYEIALYDDH